MFTAALFFMGLAVCIFAGLVCYGTARAIKVTQATQPSTDERATWNQIKAALIDFHDLLVEGNAKAERPQADTGGIS